MIRIRHLIQVAAAAALIGVAAPSAAQAPGNVKSITATLTSNAARKECLGLSAGQRLHYWYRVDGPVDFAIQVVEGKDTLYPVKKARSVIGSGNYQAKTANDYCMVWTNVAKRPVTLTFEFARLGGN
jgi:hypothetical protein